MDKCVSGKTNSVYNSLKQTWPWGSQGSRAGWDGAGQSRAGLVSGKKAEQEQWRQCADTGHQLQTTQQQGCSGHSSDRTAPSLASGQEAWYMQLSPEEILVSPSPGRPRQVELFRGSGKQAFGH